MTALHGLWTSSRLHVWGEDGSAHGRLAAESAAGAPGRADRIAGHPFALEAPALRRVIGDLWDGLLAAGAAEARKALRLPSAGGCPEPSPRLGVSSTHPPTASSRTLATWSVPCLVFSPADAIDLLTALPVDASGQVRMGESLLYWRHLAVSVTDLLAAQRMVPDVHQDRDGRHRAVWRPVLEGNEQSERLTRLIAAMPPVCRCLADERADQRNVTIVGSFLHATVDAVTRRSLADDPLSQSLQERDDAGVSPEVRWLRALVGGEARIGGSHEDRQELARRVSLWIGQLDDTAGHAHFRTCFTITPPDASDEEDDSPEAEWTIAFHLQATDDPGVVLDAGRVWATAGAGLTFLRRQYGLLREQLEADLRRAAHLFEPLAAVLDQPRPECCRVDSESAYAFLREAAPALELNGFGVRLPDWWRSEVSRLGLRLRIGPSEGGTAGAGAPSRIGLDALVDYRWQVAVGDEPLSEREFRRLCERGRSLIRVRGRWMEARPQALRAARLFLEKRPSGRITVFEALRLSVGDPTRTGLPVTGIDAGGWLGDAINGVGSEAQTITDLPQPPGFRGALRPYQLKGLSWLAFLDRFGLGGCLADDMGLGKTIQMIALLLHERLDGQQPGPTLLVVPTSLVGNWRREVARFADTLRVMVHHGTERLGGEAFVQQVLKHDVVISTYGLTHRDFEHLQRVAWHRVALDEGQNIKNPSAKQTVAIRSLHARKRSVLTGTPLENHLSELWSILEFLNPGLLGTAADFRREFAVPVEKHRDTERADRLRQLIRPFMLRRRKTDPTVIADLPEKMEMKVFCNLTAEQAALYQTVVDDMLGHVELAAGIRRRGLVLAALTRLKQVCNHPALASNGGPANLLEGRSGKCERLVEMLDEVLAEGDRALVFTQFQRMGRLLQGYLAKRLGCEILYLHGGTPAGRRDELVERFQADDPTAPVFILSLKAGGYGLNLTSANHVFHFDRWWNPAVEDQASDRAHRIGQLKTVQVHKFVCIGTLEERIDRMLEEKRDLADRIVGVGEKWLTELSTDDLREVIALSQEAVAED
ncbi:MAG TPA: DEAD/DEAH box helicase [Phycisphaerae bacterium]|nr:DEAD/DEAH box helicase [Phycisphaerae bacterium]